MQPEDRGTAAGILFPAHWIQWRDADATVVVFPSDHFVLEEGAFIGHVAGVAAFVARHTRWVVLLGAQPTEPETEYGWIEPGDTLSTTPVGPLQRVRRFWEKPPEDVARACFDAGYLWNTFVLVAHVATLLDAGRQLAPALHERLARIAAFADTADEPSAIHQAYALAPKVNFSQSILQSCPPCLAVSKLAPLTWGDLGTPERVLKMLGRVGLAPSWLRASNLPA